MRLAKSAGLGQVTSLALGGSPGGKHAALETPARPAAAMAMETLSPLALARPARGGGDAGLSLCGLRAVTFLLPHSGGDGVARKPPSAIAEVSARRAASPADAEFPPRRLRPRPRPGDEPLRLLANCCGLITLRSG
ncbi:hypothetical protein ACCO45_008865 [Purpureocillium lilacinum]|uniref:Uncharacterized protein n=1 Tax=Purpureocillium lilacinum TaxID=33203 RepID=A0ACC4DJI1_PURLI